MSGTIRTFAICSLLTQHAFAIAARFSSHSGSCHQTGHSRLPISSTLELSYFATRSILSQYPIDTELWYAWV